EGFSSRGFRVAALYDVDAEVVGEQVGPVVVRHVDQLADRAQLAEGAERLAIGVIATPADAAQGVADALVAAGVGSILNFAPRVLTVPTDVLLRYVDLSIELQVLSFYESRRADEEGEDGDDGAGGAVLRSVGLSPPPDAD